MGLGAALVFGIDIGLGNDEATTGFDDTPYGAQATALGGREKVDLHFRGQHLGLIWHDAQRRVARRRIAKREGQGRMAETVLLQAGGANLTDQGHLAFGNVLDRGPDRVHHGLSGETFMEFLNYLR